MVVTPEGEIFLKYANIILKQVDEVENMFSKSSAVKKHFSISVPRASYISDALANFSLLLNSFSDTEILYKETNSQKAIKNILDSDYKLGIVRYASQYDKFYKEFLEEKGLTYELVAEFGYVLLMHKDSPLAKKNIVTYSDLEDYIEITHADPFMPSLPFSAIKKDELPENTRHKIFVFERASQFDLLNRNINTFMWVSPIPEKLLNRYDLVQVKCPENTRRYKDVIIYRKDYKLSELDNIFIAELCKSKRQSL